MQSRIRCTAHRCQAAPLEDLAYGPDQAPVGIGYDELGAGRAAVAQLPQETEPRFVGLRVHCVLVGFVVCLIGHC